MSKLTNIEKHSVSNVIACLGRDQVRIEKRPINMPAEGEMLLQLRVVGLCGTDMFKLNTGKVNKGLVLGHEVVGEVVKTGKNVNQFNIGDRVVVPHHVPCGQCLLCQNGNETMCDFFRVNLIEPGGFADHILVKNRATSHAVRKIPDKISDYAAVFMEPAACVLRGVNRSGLGSNGTVAILGGGSMGLLHLMVIKAIRPKAKVLLIDPLDKRRTLALELGADMTTTTDQDSVAAAINMTNGFGVDVVFDTVGGSKVLESALALCRHGGSVILFAHAPDGAQAEVNLNNIFKYERRIIGTYSGALAEQFAVFDLLTSKQLDPTPLVSHVMPLDEFSTGYDLIKHRQALKVLFTPSRSVVGT